MPTRTRKLPREAFHLSAVTLALKQAGDDGRRSFEGVANTGKVLRNHWIDDFVIDFDSIQLSDITPGLINHDFRQRAAIGRLSVRDSDLHVEGTLLSNEHGKQVASDADDGFPWQLSIHVEPSSIERYESGTSVTVNGRELSGPVAVFRNSLVHEFSFTPVGVDTDTYARVLSRDGDHDQHTIEINEVQMPVTKNPGETTQTVDELQAENNGLRQQLSAAKAEADQHKARADAAVDQVATLSAASRETEVRALLSAKGVDYTEATAKPYLEMSAEVWGAVRAEAETLLSVSQGAEQQNAGLPPEFFFRPEHGAQLSHGENPLIADAKARAKAAA